MGKVVDDTQLFNSTTRLKLLVARLSAVGDSTYSSQRPFDTIL